MVPDDDTAVPSEVQDAHFIDCDFHLHVPTEDLFEYVEDDTIRRRLESHGPPPFGSTDTTRYGYPKGYTWDNTGNDLKLEKAVNREEIREVQAKTGIDEVYVTPGTRTPLGHGMYPRVTNALTRAYHDYLIDQVIDVDAGIYAGIFVPGWDAGFAAEEVERVGSRDGFVGAQGHITTAQYWGAPQFDRLFDVLTANDLPLSIHHTLHRNSQNPGLMREGSRTMTEFTFAVSTLPGIANALNMIMTGVFDKYPDLDFVVQEAGTNWIPAVAWRMDEIYRTYPGDLELAERFAELGQERLQRNPSEYLFDNVYVTTQPLSYPQVGDTEQVRKMLDACRAEEMFMYSSDWPHPTTDYPQRLLDLPVDDATMAKISHENAQDVLRIPD